MFAHKTNHKKTFEIESKSFLQVRQYVLAKEVVDRRVSMNDRRLLLPENDVLSFSNFPQCMRAI
jgi:hypothetical protein